MGGSESLDYLAPSTSGENVLVTCENGDYAADLEIARGVPRARPSSPSRSTRPSRSRRRVSRRSTLAQFLGVDEAATSKAMPVVHDGAVVLALVRGDDRLEGEARGGARRRPPRDGRRDPHGVRGRPRLARAGRLLQARSSRTRRCGGPVRRGREPDRLAPAGRRARPDFEARFATSASRRRATRARAAAAPPIPDGDRGWAHLQAGHLLFGAAGADVSRRNRKTANRDGVIRNRSGADDGGRGRAAHDEHGIVWPRRIAPYDVHVVVLPGSTSRGRRSRRRSSRTGTTCCSTTATSAPARSSPTPT